MNHPSHIYFIVLFALLSVTFAINMTNPKAVFTIPYTRTFRNDLFAQSMGCGYNVIYCGYQYPTGLKDSLKIYTQTSFYGLSFSSNCRPKDLYAKIFGYSQDYSSMRQPTNVVDSILRELRSFQNIIIDWKQIEGDLNQARQNLNQIVQKLKGNGKEVFLKVPASYLCYNVNNSPYILGVESANKIIVEMYGESTSAYKNFFDVFQSDYNSEGTSQKYPQKDCPQFPSYNLLKNKFPDKKFYIQKTLQQEEPGYLGNSFDSMLQTASAIYTEPIFYDAFPPNLIRI